MNWAEKYRPHTLKDLYLSSKNKNEIIKWIEDKQHNKKSHKNCLILHGPPGIGKTSVANIILKQYNYDVIEFNSSEIKTKKEIVENLQKINGNNNILNMMSQEKKQMGIIIDELDGLNDKSVIKELLTFIKKKNSSPFICTTNSVNKKIMTLNSKSIYIKIPKPSRLQVSLLIDKISLNEKMNLSNEIKTLILNKSQLDFRRVINLLEYINIENKDEAVIKKIIENYDKKNVVNTIYESTDKILSKYSQNFGDIYEQDKTSIGYTIYENFSDYIIFNKDENKKKKLKCIADIYRCFSESDILDKKIFIEQHFFLYKYTENMKCNYTSFVINNLKKLPYNKFNKLNYSTLINKTSLEYLNSKIINKIKSDFNVDDHLYICDYMYLSICNNKNTLTIKNMDIDPSFLEKMCKFSNYFKNTKENLNLIKSRIKELY